MNKLTRIKTESEDIPIPFPADLKALTEELAEYYHEDWEHFIIWMLSEHAKGLLENYSELGEMLSKHLQAKHDFSIRSEEQC